MILPTGITLMVHWWIIHVCFVQVTILNIVWRSRRADVPPCAHFSNNISWVIQEGVKWIEKCPHRGASGVPHVVPWTKQTWIKRQCTLTSWMLLCRALERVRPPAVCPAYLSQPPTRSAQFLGSGSVFNTYLITVLYALFRIRVKYANLDPVW